MFINRPYEVSCIDGKSYCVKNGKFTRHLTKHQITHEEYCILYKGMIGRLCSFCGKRCTFDYHTEQYKDTCSSQQCINLRISQVKLQTSEEDRQIQNSKRRNTMLTKYTDDERNNSKREMVNRMRSAGVYSDATKKRRQTCLDMHGDATFNNPTKISSTKLSWTLEQKKSFLNKMHQSLGNMTLTEYRDKFSPDWLVKRKITKVKRGLELPTDQIPAFVRYRNRVHYLTHITYKKFKHKINPKNLPRVTATVGKLRGGYQVDHILSVKYGFLNNIPPEVLADVSNLQMLHWRANIKKGWKL